MNCLTCQTLQRTQSEKENTAFENSHRRNICCLEVARSWSGNLIQPPYKQVETDRTGSPRKLGLVGKKVKSRRLHSNCGGGGGGNEPRLVRSCGMRRDWSFEDLRFRKEKKGRFF